MQNPTETPESCEESQYGDDDGETLEVPEADPGAKGHSDDGISPSIRHSEGELTTLSASSEQGRDLSPAIDDPLRDYQALVNSDSTLDHPAPPAQSPTAGTTSLKGESLQLN